MAEIKELFGKTITKAEFETWVIDNFRSKQAKQAIIDEGLLKSYQYFASALNHLNDIITKTKYLANYAKDKKGLDIDPYMVALTILKFYLNGFKPVPGFSWRERPIDIRTKVKNFFKIGAKSYELNERVKTELWRINDLIKGHETEFVGGLRKSGLVKAKDPGYGTDRMRRKVKQLFNLFMTEKPDKAGINYVELVRLLKEQLTFCEAGTTTWLEQLSGISGNLYLTRLKKSVSEEQKSALNKIFSELKSKSIPTIWQWGTQRVTVEIADDFKKSLKEKCNVKPGLFRYSYFFTKVDNLLGIPLVFTISGKQPIKYLEENNLLAHKNADGSFISKDFELIDKSLKGFRMAVLTGQSNVKLLGKLLVDLINLGLNFKSVRAPVTIVFLKDVLEGEQLQGDNEINPDYLNKFEKEMKKQFPLLALNKFIGKKCKTLFKDDQDSSIPIEIPKDFGKESDLTLKDSSGGIIQQKFKFHLVPLDFESFFKKMKDKLKIDKKEDLYKLFYFRSPEGLMVSDNLNKLGLNVNASQAFKIALFTGQAKKKLIEKFETKFDIIKDKDVLMFVATTLGKQGGGNDQSIEANLDEYLNNVESFF